MKALVIISVALLCVGAAFAGGFNADSAGGGPAANVPPAPYPSIGSIISSFVILQSSGSGPNTYGIHRNDASINCVRGTSGTRYVYSYDTSGSIINSVAVTGWSSGYPRDEDNCHLGSGYLSAVGGYNASVIYLIEISTGSVIQSWNPTQGGGYSMNLTWDGTYYYFNGYRDNGSFQLYDTSGSSAGSWNASGWPGSMTTNGGVGYATSALGNAGTYLVANSYGSGQPSCILEIPSGSLIATWSTWSRNGQGGTVGLSSDPGTYGPTWWTCWYNFGGAYKTALEVDIEGVAGAVTPTSIGKIKALYR